MDIGQTCPTPGRVLSGVNGSEESSFQIGRVPVPGLGPTHRCSLACALRCLYGLEEVCDAKTWHVKPPYCGKREGCVGVSGRRDSLFYPTRRRNASPVVKTPPKKTASR